MTDEDVFYGLMLQELHGWRMRSVTHAGRRWEAVIVARSTRGIEAAASDNPLLALRTAWRKVERRLGV